MSPGLIVLIAVGGSLLLTGGILFIVFSAVRKAAERQRAMLDGEGVVKDSGSVHVTTRLQGWRSPGLYVGAGIQAGPGRLVLTRARLVILPMSRRRSIFSNVTREVLGHYRVGVRDGRLNIHAENPPGASGSVDVLFSVSDPEAWVAVLREAGAQA